MATPPPRPPLPFGLGREPACDPARCLDPGVRLPQPGSQIHDQVAQALSALFSTFYATSLRYLGVSEILDWIETNGTVDAWILTGLEQQRSPAEVGSSANLEVGRGAIRSVIRAALAQDDEAWATSLREVGFSSGMSMAYEGIISQLKPNKSSPLPCLHTLITQAGLNMLKSAPLKHSFPICPPRTPPSPAPLLSSIRTLLASGTSSLSGPSWKQPSVWRPQVRKAFARYHQMVKEVAEEVVCEPAFSKEYTIFLESISQPIQLLHLISEDFEQEFGPGACKGLLGVGEVGGQNLCAIMDFCAAKRPSELLARVKQRVAEKTAREKLQAAIDKNIAAWKTAQTELISVIDRQTELYNAKIEIPGVDLGDLEEKLQARHTVLEKELAALQAVRNKLVEERDRKLDIEQAARAKQQAAALGPPKPPANGAFQQGSSKDLLAAAAAADPFSATAPRAVSPSTQSNKGKGKAANPAPSRYGANRNVRADSPARSLSTVTSSRPASPSPSFYDFYLQEQRKKDQQKTADAKPVTSSQLAPPPIYTPPASPPNRSANAKLAASPLSREPSPARTDEMEADGFCDCDACRDFEAQQELAGVDDDDACCAGCAHEAAEAAAANQVEHNSGTVDSAPADSLAVPDAAGGKKKKKKKKSAKAKQALPPAVAPLQPAQSATLTAPPPTVAAALAPLSRVAPPTCCPPDRCTGDRPNLRNWPAFDQLLFETILSGFRYELIDALGSALEPIRDRLAKNYLRMGGLMLEADGRVKDMNEFMLLAEKGMWTNVGPEVEAFSLRTLATSLQKLLEVFRAQLGDNLCVCRLSCNLDVLEHARHRLTQCEMADRKVPIQLPEMNHQNFIKWCHGELRAGNIGGSEWEGRERSYRVQDFLLSFSDAFDAAIDRLVDSANPYLIADDTVTLLEYIGGVRTFDVAARLGTGNLYAALDANGGGPKEARPLQAWGRFLELSAEARMRSTPFNHDLAEQEKMRGNALFAAGEYQKSLVCFGTASIIAPTLDTSFWTNAAAARLKIATTQQYSEAVSDCTYALEIDPKCVKALYRRGMALQALGHWKPALRDLTELVRISPENETAKEALDLFLKQKPQ